MFPVDLLPAKPQTAQLRGKRLSPFKPPPELLAVKRPVKPLPGMSDPSVRKELPVTEISYAADDTEDNNVLSTADSQSYTTADRKLKTRAGRTARKESSESEPLESGPGSVLRAARRSLQEISRVATASRPLRRSVASEKTLISRGPENIDFGPAGADKGWIDAGSTATQLSQFTNPAEDDGKKPEEKSLAAMLEYVPTQDIARRLVASIDEFERDFTTSQHRCEEGEPHPIANRIVCDSAVTAAALRDASGLSGRSSVVISLYQLQKGMNTPPSELPLRFYQEKVVPLGLDTDAAIVRGKGDAGPQPKWDPKSKQWKMTTFPTAKPSNRDEAIALSNVADCMLEEVKSLSIPAITSTESIVNSSLDTTTVEWITNGFRPEIAAEINVWSVITQELVRQVYFHCEERGILLHRARARLLEMLSASDIWMRCHLKSREFEQERIAQLETQLQDMQLYIDNQDRQMHLVLEKYARRQADLRSSLNAANHNYEELRKMFMEHISTVGAPGEIKLGDELDIWDGFKDTDNNPANEDSIILSLKDSVKAVIQKTRRSNWDFMLKNMDRLRAHSRLETMKEKLAKTGDLLSMAAAHDTAEVNATNAVMEKRRSRSMSLAAGQEAMQSLMQAAMGGRARSHSIDQQEFKVGATIPTVRRDSMTRGGDGAVASGAISERSQSEERPNTSNSHPVRSRGSKEPAARKAAPNKKAPAKKPVKKVKKKAPVRPATPSSSDEEEETSLGSLSSDSDEDEPQRKHGHSEVVSKKVDRVVFDSRSSLPKTRSWRPVTPTTPITPAPSATAPSFADVLVIGPVPSTAHSSRRASATLSNTGRPVTPVIPSSLGVARPMQYMKPPPPELSLVVGIGSSVVSPHPERRRRSSLSTQDIAELSSLVSNTETLVAEAPPSKRRPSIAPQSASAVLPPSAGSIGFDLLRPTTSEYTTAVAESVDSPSGAHAVEDSSDSDGEGDVPADATKRFHCPKNWKKFLNVGSNAFQLGKRGGGGKGGKESLMGGGNNNRLIPRKQMHQFILQILQQKLVSDKDEAKDSEGGVVVSSLDDFVINFMMFKFGHKNLVKTRLTSLINTVFALEASDKLIHTFGRFCGLIAPALSSDALQFCLLGIQFSTSTFPSVNPTSKDTTVYLDLSHCLRGMDILFEMYHKNPTIAKDRLIVAGHEGKLPDADEADLPERAAKYYALMGVSTGLAKRNSIERTSIASVSRGGGAVIDLPTLFQVLLDTWKSSSIKTVLQLRRMFEEVDINQDGILQFDEFRVLLDKIQEHVAMNTMEEEADERRSTAGSSHSLLQMKLAPKIAVSTSAARRLYTEAVSLSDSGHVTEESFIRVAYKNLTEKLQQLALMSADMTEVEIVDDDDSKAVRSESTASAEGCEDGAAIAGEDTTDGDSVATPQARVPSAPGITATKGSPDVSKLKATPLAAAGKLNNFRPAGNGG